MMRRGRLHLIRFIVFLMGLTICLLTIGFSSFSASMDLREISAIIAAQNLVKVTGSRFESASSGGTSANLTYTDYDIAGSITLPNATSSVTYAITVTNLGNTEVGLSSVTNLDSRLQYTISGYTEGTKLCDDSNPDNCSLNSISTFYITISYADNQPVINNAIPFTATFNFGTAYNITYISITNASNYQKSIVAGNTLSLTFTTDIPEAFKITTGTGQLINNYTYNQSGISKILTIPNIYSNIIIERYYEITYNLSGGTNNASNPTRYLITNSVPLEEPTKTDYIFDGWYTTSSFTGSKITSTSNYLVIPIYMPIGY